MASARSYRATVQSIPNSVWTDLSASAARWDDGPMWSAANPTRLTTTASGLHIVGANVGFVAATGGRWARIMRGGDTRNVAMTAQAAGAGLVCAMSPSTLVDATAGDYYVAALYQNSGAALNTDSVVDHAATDFHLTTLPAGAVGARRESAAAQSIPNATWTLLTLDTTVFDTSTPAMASGSTLVAPADGHYAMWAGAYIPAAAGIAGAYWLLIQAGGLNVALSGPGSSIGSATAISTTATRYLTAGQVLTAYFYQASGAPRLLDTTELRPYLAAARIGP